MKSFVSGSFTKAILFVGLISSIQDRSYAQNGCARCVAPPLWSIPSRPSMPATGVVTRYRPDQVPNDGSTAGSSPFYREESSNAETNPDPAQVRLFTPVRQQNRLLIPTGPSSPGGLENVTEPADPATSPNRASPGKETVAEKIHQRYSDPRVVRMMQQLSPQKAETFYVEVSELIDERHLQPPTYSRRVDNALDHFSRALDVPAFRTASQVRATSAEVSTFQEELQNIRSQVRVRNLNDAVAIMRDVRQRAVRSVHLRPAAVGMEFLYGTTDSLDQFSMLLPPEKNGGPNVGLRDNFVGIGVELEPHSSGLKILKPLPGGPAAQADLRRGDIITHINGKEVKPLDFNQAVELIAGPEGTSVQIQASRRGNLSGSVTLVRQKMSLFSVVDVRMQDPGQGIGYLKLEQFADSTMSEIDNALMKLHRQGMTSLILDLRGNPGGLLSTAIALSDRFLPAGTIVATKGRTPEDNSRETAHFPNTWKMPLVVLVDHNSASASEIFAAAIQENRRGVIIGEKSYGKGTVQTLFPLHTVPAALRLTTAKFYSPDGREMAGVGVTPDVVISNENTEPGQKDEVLNEAVRQVVDPRTRVLSEQLRRSGEVTSEFNLAA